MPVVLERTSVQVRTTEESESASARRSVTAAGAGGGSLGDEDAMPPLPGVAKTPTASTNRRSLMVLVSLVSGVCDLPLCDSVLGRFQRARPSHSPTDGTAPAGVSPPR